MTGKSTLSTAADSLLNLLKSEKEISFKNAAKKLNVSTDTIEAWAGFLQEGKLMSVKYKFMTPYAVLSDLAGPGVENTEDIKKVEIDKAVKRSRDAIHKLMEDTGNYSTQNSDPNEFIKKMESTENSRKIKNLLNSFSQSLENGDFLVLDQIIRDSLVFLRQNVDALLRNKNLGPQKKVEISEAMKLIEKKVRSASDMIKSKKFDDASKLYSEIKIETEEFSGRIRGNIQDQQDLQIGYDSIKKLFLRTHHLLNSGKVAEASDAYEEAERIIKGLSDKIKREKSEMQSDIIKLNQDFATITARVREKKLDEITKLIRDFDSKANNSLKKKDIASAKQYYVEIESRFREFPPGFSKEKEKLKKRVLKLFSKIVSEERRQTKAEFDFFYKKIGNILKSSKKPSTTLEDYLRMYQDMLRLFNKLPGGFMREKVEVQREIILFYNSLIEEFESFSNNSVRRGISQINELMTAMKAQIDSDDLDNASNTYTKINSVFGNLPKGFLDQKTKIQQSILDVYETLIDKKNRLEKPSRKDSKNISDIEKLLEELEKTIVVRNYPQSYLLYKRIKNVYNGIDSLSAPERERLTEKILAAYKKIVLLRSLQEEHSLELPPVIHVDPKKEVKDMIQDLRQRYKPKVTMPLK